MSAKVIGYFFIVAVTAAVLQLIHAFITPHSMSWWLVGPVIGYWLTRPYFFAKTIELKEIVEHEIEPKENWRHPYPKEYNMPLPETFAAVRQSLEKCVFNLSDKWHLRADTYEKRIVAQLNIREEEHASKPTRKYLEAEILFHDADKGTTVVEFHFAPRPEEKPLFGFDPVDSYVKDTVDEVEARLGSGKIVSEPHRYKEQYEILNRDIKFRRTPPPSWGLIVVSSVGLLFFIMDIVLEIWK